MLFLHKKCQAQCVKGAKPIEHSVKEQVFHKAQCQGFQDFERHIFKEQILQDTSVRELFSFAQCQGAYFYETQCQGAYAGDDYTDFKNLIGKETELKTMQFAW